MKFSSILFALLIILFSCNEDGNNDQSINKEAGNRISAKPTANRDVKTVGYDFNDDGINDGIKQMSENEEGKMRVVYVYIKEDGQFVPTYDQYENEMMYPGDSIQKTEKGNFKFMYHSGDYFTFDFEKEEGNWIARQVQE